MHNSRCPNSNPARQQQPLKTDIFKLSGQTIRLYSLIGACCHGNSKDVPLQMRLPVCQVVVVVIGQAFSKKVAVTQVARLEVGVVNVQSFNELNARGAAEAAGTAHWHRMGCILGGGLTALVPSCGRWSIACLKAWAGLAMAP